jgi:hypothetical protein
MSHCFDKTNANYFPLLYHPLVKADWRQSCQKMLTDTHEEFPPQSLRCYWPQEFFVKRRRFHRQAENQPYIEWLQASFDDGDEDDEDDEDDYVDDSSEDEDQDVVDGQRDKGEHKDENRNDGKDTEASEACEGHGKVRLFMKGMTGDEDKLQYRDQVEQVARFCEQTSFGELERHVALLDDRNDGGTNLKKEGYCRPYQGPLTSQRLAEELIKKVAQISCSHQISRETHTLHSDSESSQAKVSLPTHLKMRRVTRRGG